MKLTTTVILPSLAAFAVASPGLQESGKRQNVDWKFSLFQNTQCTGANDTYSGAGDKACTGGIRNGAASAWWKIFINADCEVTFYDDPGCTNLVDAIDEDDEPAVCSYPPGALNQLVAYEVSCD
ncbi:hypothetical protein BJ170DRAFT_735492 [Xylariales sp. AK1849]|nr:hypothetical protein BJ170DRAFT_735492 [Xylariales sp. AK1849]